MTVNKKWESRLVLLFNKTGRTEFSTDSLEYNGKMVGGLKVLAQLLERGISQGDMEEVVRKKAQLRHTLEFWKVLDKLLKQNPNWISPEKDSRDYFTYFGSQFYTGYSFGTIQYNRQKNLYYHRLVRDCEKRCQKVIQAKQQKEPSHADEIFPF